MIRMKRFLTFLLLTSYFLLVICGQVWGAADTLRPVGDRAYTQWTSYPSGNKWDAFDDTTANEDTNYVYSTTAGHKEGWYHSNFTASDNIDSVRLTVRAKQAIAGDAGEIIISRNYSSEGFWYACVEDEGVDTITLTSDYTDYPITWGNDPCTGSGWTQSGLNSSARAWLFKNYTIGENTFGKTSCANLFNINTNYLSLYRFQATFTADIDSLAILYEDQNNVSNCRLAIYSDSGTSGYPYQLLDSTAEFSISNGWNRQPLVTGGVSVTENSYYWIGFRVSASGDSIKRESGPANFGRYKAYAYSSAWPATAPTTMTGEATLYCVQAMGDHPIANRVTQSFITIFYSEGVRNRLLLKRQQKK